MEDKYLPRLQSLFTSLAVAACLCLANVQGAFAVDPVEGDPVDLSTELGYVNLTGHITEAISLMSLIVAAVVAGFVIFRVLVPKGLAWIRRAV